MKKGFVFLLSIISAALVGFIPIKADEITTNYEDINIVTPVLTEQQVKEYDTALYLIEYLRQGGYVDFSNINNNYSLDNFIDDFCDSLDSLITGERYSSKEMLTMERTVNLTGLGLDLFTNIYRNNLVSLDNSDNPTPTPTPPVDYAQYIDNINGSGFDFIRNMDIATWNGRFNNVPMSYPSFNGLPSSYSWYTYSNTGNDIPWSKTQFSYITSALFCSEHGIDTINIYLDDVDNKYKCIIQKNNTQYYTDSSFPIAYSDNWINGNSSPNGTLYGNFYTYSNYLCWANCNPWYNGGWSTKTLSNNTLEGLFQSLQRYVRNVNIYVNGVPWSIVGQANNYYVSLGNGTFIEDTNTPVEWKYDEDIYIDIQDILDRLETLIQNQNKISFPDFSDLIVDENGQQAVAVKIVNDKDNIDDAMVKEYATLIPIFPVFVTYPINVEDVSNIATIGITDVIPDDIMQVCFIALLGMLFVTFIHRNLE